MPYGIFGGSYFDQLQNYKAALKINDNFKFFPKNLSNIYCDHNYIKLILHVDNKLKNDNKFYINEVF